MSMKAAATAYANYGWLVLPVEEGGKAPATGHGVKDATTSPEKIASWWDHNPAMNVGIATGRESGIVVIDVDKLASLRALVDERGPLPDTASVRTPRGVHLYFEYPEGGLRNSAGRLGEGIDTRGDGGYVLAPPSVNGGGEPYRWRDLKKPVPLPQWVLEALREAPADPGPFAMAAHPGTEQPR